MIQWNNPETLDLEVRKAVIDQINHKRRVVPIGCTIVGVALLLPAIIDPEGVMSMFALLSPIIFLIAVLSMRSTSVNKLRKGEFFWHVDYVSRVSRGGKYTTSLVYGEPTPDGDIPVYYPANLVLSYHIGDKILCIEYYYDENSSSLGKMFNTGVRPHAFLANKLNLPQ